jgi:hypothetical protein
MNIMTQTVRSTDIGVDLVEDPSALRVFLTPDCADCSGSYTQRHLKNICGCV